MILLLDTSTPTCKLILINGKETTESEWLADRQLAKGLLEYLKTQLAAQSKTWNDLTGIGVRQGPGSFTGLRIGITVLNTIADTKGLPIVGETGDDWRKTALDRLARGENDQLVMPIYGREATITVPRK
jgi:tRNA threonylcarbamoyladenosine biosynthesis protein TsaB